MRALTEFYWNKSFLNWIYFVLHRQTFFNELAEFEGIRRRHPNLLARVDPAFLAILYMVMVWSASIMGPDCAREIEQHVSLDDLRKTLPDAWMSMIEDCLKAAQWAERPQIRVAQALCLKLAFSRTPRESRNDVRDSY